MMTQFYLFSRHVMGSGTKPVSVVGTNIGKCLDNVKFEALDFVKVQYLGNQVRGSHTNYQRQRGNKG
ncbi:hypothetical protein MTR67_047808 [Solanum verrucosum]|uniref:Uncharacterized protein n=1 Tax=Solanum verrucosum TaxID=315347 RepID=A0AAF0ZYK2_SOLVR|nr:hypothetical protein MTR67_047808 [Solanum verrucosum]